MSSNKYRVVDNTLYVNLEGRVDASNASIVENEILEIRSANPTDEFVLDADKLEYISSAGLRIVLRLRKQEKNMKLINVSSSVYEILEMTGFTDIIEVTKAYRRISIDGCKMIGKGANGAIYRYDDETIVKIFHNPDSLNEIKTERELARKAFVLGINTAIPYDIVRVGDGYGSVSELLNARGLAELVLEDTNNIDEPVRLFVDLLKKIHSVTVEKGEMPDMKAIAVDWAMFLENHIPAEDYEKLYYLMTNAPEGNQLLHGDYHTNNVMVQEGETLLIDMDTLCMGHPIFELAFMFNALIGYSEVDPTNSIKFFGYDFETAKKFWDIALKSYLGSNDESVCKAIEEKAMVIGYARMLRRAIRHTEDADSPAKIARCKEMLEYLLNKVDTLTF